MTDTPPSWRARLRRWRNRKIADPAFQAKSVKIPGVSMVARRKADQLFELTAGFVYSQILFACVELELFKHLKDGPRSTSELQDLTGLDPDPLTTLLKSAENLELITRLDDMHWWLDDLGAVLAHEPGIEAMIRHHAMLYRDLSDPIALLKNRGPDAEIAKFWAYPHARHDKIADDHAHSYSHLMAVSQAAVAGQVLEAYDFSAHKSLCDVGGGHGAFLSAIGRAHPQLALHLFDLPQVAEQGAKLMAENGFEDRVSAHGGSFFEDRLPRDLDCYSLIRVLYDHDDHRIEMILSAVHKAMPAGATLVVSEPMDGTGRSERLVGAYFALYLWAMGSGRCRSTDRIAEMLTKAGFSGAARRPNPQPLFASVVTATR
ncbi:MAG: methyltransferase [Pseudomonadota bacterium]